MKQFLRYQVSGSVFIIWCVIFYAGGECATLEQLKNFFWSSAISKEKGAVLALLAMALPLGVIIHQISVSFKNWILGVVFNSLSDDPIKFQFVDFGNEKNKYYLERISNLNSFYYVRVDNGFFSPLFAFIFIKIGLSINQITWVFILLALAIGVSVLVYVYRIYRELRFYESELRGKSLI